MTLADRFPTKTGYALLGVDDRNKQIVSVAWKETYEIGEDGSCLLAEEQEPLLLDAETQEEKDLKEPEVLPFKLATDFVVLGSACAPGGRPVLQMKVAIEVASRRKEILVIGDRVCSFRKDLAPVFSEPEPFEKMSICYERAYGGVDLTVEEPVPENLLDFLGPPLGAYPRNDCGLGYAVTNNPSRIEGLALPNLEDPNDRLSPDRLIARSPENWWKQPLPQSFDWFSPAWYPRVTYLGAIPDGLPEDDRSVPEVRLGYIPPGQAKRIKEASFENLLQLEFANAASPGLILPYLKGDESILLRGMRPEGDWVITLPGKIPEMVLGYRKITYKLTVLPHTVIIDTEKAKLILLWRGSWQTRDPLPIRYPHLKKPDVDPLEGVEIWVNRQNIHER